MSRIVNAQNIALFASLLLLGGVAAEKVSLRPPADSLPYHARIRKTAATLPVNVNAWTGEEVPEPYDVVKLLAPNVLITRSYGSGNQKFWFLIVQCPDSRTLIGHYPPICYSEMGYRQLSSVPMDWPVVDFTVTGTEYQFMQSVLDPTTSIIVDNFMILPDGRFARDMDAMAADAADLRKRGFGAAEVQFVFQPGFDLAQRRTIVGEFLHAATPLMSAIRSGPKN